MVPRDLTGFFCPKSVAIVGASRSADKVGSIVLQNIIASSFDGKIYPVNPNADTLKGKQCYKDIASLPETPDLAVVALPAELSIKLAEELGAKGIKNIVLYAAGFKETGEAGRVLEDKLLDVAEKYKLNILGPNCLGFVNNTIKLNATFGQSMNETGKIKFISQSGAIAASIFDWSKSIGLGFSEFVTLGNKSVITENDVLAYFQAEAKKDSVDHGTPIGMYLESISDGPEFLKLTSELSKTHPIFVIKPGKTHAAVSAMKSHTGSMAGEDDVLEAVLVQAGVIRCNSLEEFFDVAKAFAWGVIPDGPNVAVISNAGGPGVLTADAVVLEGLSLTTFDALTKKKLEEVLPRTATILDPIDLMGDALAERYGHAAEIILENSSVNYLLFILTPQLMTQIDKTAEFIAFVSHKYKKPIFCSFIGGNLVSEGEDILNKNKIPAFRFPERAIHAIAVMWRYKQSLKKKLLVNEPSSAASLPPQHAKIRAMIKDAEQLGIPTLDNISADMLIKLIGINTPPTQLLTTVEEAQVFAKQNGWPVVLKLSARGLLHKMDLGGVITNITNEEMLNDSFHKLLNKIDQLQTEKLKNIEIQVQKGVVGGIEVIVGVKIDPTFGPVIMFGAGGSYVEIIGDKNIKLLPVSSIDVKELVEKAKIFKVLKSHDGQPAYPLDKLYDLILKISRLASVVPEVAELEINPVILTLNDVWAIDSKVVMKPTILNMQPQINNAGPKYKIAKTLSHVTLASKFNHYQFEAEEPLEFEAGQYISVKVAETAVRAYSVATRSDTKHFDLLVDTRPGGPGSMFFENLKAGDKMLFMGPFGKFILHRDDGAEDLLFLATGSGTSAIRCMIDRALLELNLKNKMKLYLGLTYREEIFWQEHFDKLAQKFSNFSYEIALFKPDDKWQGAKGFITELVKKDYPDAQKCAAYLCGHIAMMTDAATLLKANGCPEARIYSERFV